jgi:hypothetical protein
MLHVTSQNVFIEVDRVSVIACSVLCLININILWTTYVLQKIFHNVGLNYEYL